MNFMCCTVGKTNVMSYRVENFGHEFRMVQSGKHRCRVLQRGEDLNLMLQGHGEDMHVVSCRARKTWMRNKWHALQGGEDMNVLPHECRDLQNRTGGEGGGRQE